MSSEEKAEEDKVVTEPAQEEEVVEAAPEEKVVEAAPEEKVAEAAPKEEVADEEPELTGYWAHRRRKGPINLDDDEKKK